MFRIKCKNFFIEIHLDIERLSEHICTAVDFSSDNSEEYLLRKQPIVGSAVENNNGPLFSFVIYKIVICIDIFDNNNTKGTYRVNTFSIALHRLSLTRI